MHSVSTENVLHTTATPSEKKIMGDAAGGGVKFREKMSNSNNDKGLSAEKQRHRRTVSDLFEDPSMEGFVDDDGLMTSQTQEEAIDMLDDSKNFIERDDFEQELGSPSEDPLAEDFTEISKHEIVDVVGDDKAGRPVVVVYAYRLPSNKTFNHQKFLRYLKQTLDKFVDQDYTIVYFHYGLKSHNKPPVWWLMEAYKALDRRYKKNLKAMYLVHPTRFIRFIWQMFKPFISHKFERKLRYVNFIRELREFVHAEQMTIPAEILKHDEELSAKAKPSKAASLQRIVLPTTQFGVHLSFILKNNPDREIPPVVSELIEYLRKEALHTEGLFRRSAVLSEVKKTQEKINRGEKVDFLEENNVHLAAVLLKTFLRELAEPVMTFDLYQPILDLQSVPTAQKLGGTKKIVDQLPPENYKLIKTVVGFLTEVQSRSDANQMNANNLALVFGPNLAWPRDGQVSLAHLQHLNSFCYRLLTNYAEIFS